MTEWEMQELAQLAADYPAYTIFGEGGVLFAQYNGDDDAAVIIAGCVEVLRTQVANDVARRAVREAGP